jgi:hypothetical protein
VSGVGVVRDHIGGVGRDRHRAGEVQLLPARRGLAGERARRQQRPAGRPQAAEIPPESFTVNDTVLGVTAWENVAVGATETGLPVDPAPGVTVVTADGGVAGCVVSKIKSTA